MEVFESLPLSTRTTFRIGGAARYFLEIHNDEDITTALAFSRERGLPLRVLGAGSNVLVPDEGIEAVVMHVAHAEVAFTDSEDHVVVLADAGMSWDALVATTTSRGLFGIENLAAIPGTVGGAVVQNIGAYGTELSQTFLYADCIALDDGTPKRFEASDVAFAYRSSCFKRDHSHLIVRVAFRLSKQGILNTSYPDLARVATLGTTPLATPEEVAAAVRTIRAGKFPSKTEGGTAGSFFKNPVISNALVDTLKTQYPDLPVFPQSNGESKVSLAWILDHILGLKGYAKGLVRLYEKQPLVLVAEHDATAHDVDALAQEIQTRVFDATTISIEREVETFFV